MCFAFPRLLAATLMLAAAPAAAADLKVCADPNNLPFSDANGGGFENKIAAILAREMAANLSFDWWAQRRGFLRNTLRAGRCDLVLGLAAGEGPYRITPPYYRSGYVFVTRSDGSAVASLDDAVLRTMRIGVQLIGDDGANTPPAEALARRGLASRLRGYPVYGNYAREVPSAPVVEAVEAGDVDVAVVWGPVAGYLARHATVPLTLTPVTPAVDGPMLPMRFDVVMGVRKDDHATLAAVTAALRARGAEIDKVLADYGVPRFDAFRQAGRAP
jgi:mxaJ protein